MDNNVIMEKGEEYNDESYTIAFIQTKVLD